MAIHNALASVAVRDWEASVRWYESILNAPASRPMPGVAEWSFERGGGLQVYRLPERAGSGSFTLIVSNLEEQVARIRKLNIDVANQPANDQVKTLMITDPDGNHIAFAEPLDANLIR